MTRLIMSAETAAARHTHVGGGFSKVDFRKDGQGRLTTGAFEGALAGVGSAASRTVAHTSAQRAYTNLNAEGGQDDALGKLANTVKQLSGMAKQLSGPELDAEVQKANIDSLKQDMTTALRELGLGDQAEVAAENLTSGLLQSGGGGEVHYSQEIFAGISKSRSQSFRSFASEIKVGFALSVDLDSGEMAVQRTEATRRTETIKAPSALGGAEHMPAGLFDQAAGLLAKDDSAAGLVNGAISLLDRLKEEAELQEKSPVADAIENLASLLKRLEKTRKDAEEEPAFENLLRAEDAKVEEGRDGERKLSVSLSLARVFAVSVAVQDGSIDTLFDLGGGEVGHASYKPVQYSA